MQMKNRRHVLGLIVLGILLFIIHCGNITTAPEHLIGVWRTQDSRYADRTFKIEERTIRFQTGEHQFETYSILRINTGKGAKKEGSLCTIDYKTEEGKSKFSFYYDPADHGVIRFANQPQMLWTRKGK